MVVEFTIPDLGEEVVKVRIKAWLKRVGDQAELDEPVVEVTTRQQKVALLAPARGVLSATHKQEGELVRVGEVIGALYTSAGSTTKFAAGEDTLRESRIPEDLDEEDTFITEAHLDSSIIMSAGERLIGDIDDTEDPKIESGLDEDLPEEDVSLVIDLLKAMEKSPKTSIDGSTQSYEMPRGKPTEKMFGSGQTDPPPPPPAALEKGVDSANGKVPLPAPKRSGRIRKFKRGASGDRDPSWEEFIPDQKGEKSNLRAAKDARDKGEKETETRPGDGLSADETEVSETYSEQPGGSVVTVFDEIDVSQIGLEGSDLRRQYFGRYKTRLTLLPFFVKASAIALGKVPRIGAQLREGRTVYSDCCDVGIVFEGNKGPIVPILRDIQSLSFIEVVQELSDLQQRVFQNQLTEDELEGGSLTITDFGEVGVHLITPPLHPPRSVALALHALRRKPVVKGENVLIHPMMYIALAYDQRVVRNQNAIAFLATIKDCIQEPMRLFSEI